MSGAPQFRAFRVSVCWNVTIAGQCIDSGFPYEPEDDDNSTYSDQNEQWKAITPEVRSIAANWFRLLARLGCITGDRQEETPHIFLISDGACELPETIVPFDPEGDPVQCLGLDQNRSLEAVPGAKIDILAWVDNVDLSEVHGALLGLAADAEMSPWGGERTRARLPQDGEAMETWLARVAVPSEQMQSFAARLEFFGLNLDLALACPPSTSAQPEFIVDGLLPAGEVSMLVGVSGLGKSSLVHELLAVAAAPHVDGAQKTFLGRAVTGQYFAALVSGEEPAWYYLHRQAIYNQTWPGDRVMRFEINRSALKETLQLIRSFAARVPGADKGILVIDSVQVFIEGDDTKSHVANEFHEMLRSFARDTGWAVVGVHHPTKASSRSLAQFRMAVKGSGAHVDEPRNVFAMLDRGAGVIEFGTVKTNMPADIAWLKEGEGVLCRRDPTTFTLKPIARNEDANTRANGDDIERVADAIRKLNEAIRVVHRTGAAGIYEQRLPALAGLSRSFIQQAVNSLIECGRVQATKDGLLLIEFPGAPNDEPTS